MNAEINMVCGDVRKINVKKNDILNHVFELIIEGPQSNIKVGLTNDQRIALSKRLIEINE